MESTISEIAFPKESYGSLREAKPTERSEDFAQIMEKQKPASENERKEQVSSDERENLDDPQGETGVLPGCPGPLTSAPTDPTPPAKESSAPNFDREKEGGNSVFSLLAEPLQAEKVFFSSENAGQGKEETNSFLGQGMGNPQLSVRNEKWNTPQGEKGNLAKGTGSQSPGAQGAKHPQPSPGTEDSIPWAVEKDETPANFLSFIDNSRGEAGKEGLFPEGKKDEGLRIPQSIKTDPLESFGRIIEGGERSYQTSGVSKEEGVGSKNSFHLINDRGEVPQQVSQRFIWSLAHGEERIRLTLDPPELGTLYLEIHREKENVRATVLTDNQMAKTVLEGHQLEIQKIIEKEGFTLEKFDVSVDPQMSSFRESREKEMNRERELYAWGQKSQEGASPASLSFLPNLPRIPGVDRYVDLWV